MQRAPLDAFTGEPGSIGMSCDLGFGLAGRIARLQAEGYGGDFYLAWERVVAPHVQLADTVAYVFINGELAHKLPVADFAIIARPAGFTSVYVDVLLFISNEFYNNWAYFDYPVFRTKLTWSQDGEATEAYIYESTTSPVGTTTGHIALLDYFVPVVTTLPASGGAITVGGRRTITVESFEEIVLTFTAGLTGVATVAYTYAGVARTLTTQSYPQTLVNGITVAFEEGHTWVNAQTCTIAVGLPTSYTTQVHTTEGVKYWRVKTVMPNANTSLSNQVSRTVRLEPSPPTLTSAVYVELDDEWTLTYAAPADADVAGYMVMRSRREAEFNDRDAHWLPIAQGAVAASATFVVVIPGLFEGLNVAECLVYDTFGLRSSILRTELILDSDSEEVDAYPEPPLAISAVVNGEDIVLTITVDSTSTSVNVYHDDTTGTIDYGTVVANEENPAEEATNDLTVTLSGLADGLYLIGVRALNGTYEETNTDMYVEVLLDTGSPYAILDLKAVGVFK